MSMNLTLCVDNHFVNLWQTRTDQTYRVLALPKDEQFQAYVECLLERHVDKHSKIPRVQVLQILSHILDIDRIIQQGTAWEFDME